MQRLSSFSHDVQTSLLSEYLFACDNGYISRLEAFELDLTEDELSNKAYFKKNIVH